MKMKSLAIAMLAFSAFAAPAFAAETCKTAVAPLAKAVASFDEHSRGIVILARDGSAESRSDAALFRSRAIEASLAGFLVVEYSADTGKAMVMNELSEKEISAFDGVDLSPARLAKIVGGKTRSVTVIRADRAFQHEAFGTIEEAVRFFTAV